MDKTSFLQKRRIGVIGYGKFGKLLCDVMLKEFKVSVYSPHLPEKFQNQNIVPNDNLSELVKNSDLIILSVPISEFETVVKNITPLLNDETIIMDVCSVKVYPVEIMKKYLPANVQIIASHPLFGPTVEKILSLKGSHMVMQNISALPDSYTKIVQYFESLDIEIIEMTAIEHDKLMARSQFFTQMVRYIAKSNSLHATRIDTPAADLLFKAFDYIGTDEKLLADMIKYNKYCQEILNLSIKSLTELQNI